MNAYQKKQKRQILSDPIAIFSTQYPDADAGEKTRLNELYLQMQSLNNSLNECRDHSKALSRKIGEAKRNNQSANNHIQSMQEHSVQCKKLSANLKEIEGQILDFFVISNDNISPVKDSHTSSPGRKYTTSTVNIDEITICLLDKDDSSWNAYVSNQPAATIHHRTEWRNLFQKVYGLECLYFYARDNNNKIVGLLPLTRLKSHLFGDLLVSMPYFQRGGAVADHPLIEQKLMQAANDRANQLGVDHIEYRDDIPRKELPVRSNKVNMVLPLPDSIEDLWNNFTPKLRAQIKRPQRAEPQVYIGRNEQLDDFYTVYARNMRDLGSPAHSKQLVEHILNSFPDNSWVIVLRLNNKPVSAGLLLGHGDTMEIPLASTLREANPHSMNMLLYWEVLKIAIERGYTAFDFGRSSKTAGTYRFKQQWGAQPKQLYWHYWLSENVEMPRLNPDNPKYALVINLWKRLPLCITKWLGPRIVRNLP